MWPLNVISATQGFKITLTGEGILDQGPPSSDTRSAVVFGDDGNMYRELGNPTIVRTQMSPSTDWVKPVNNVTDYEVMATLTGSALDGGSAALNTWLPAGTEYIWAVSLTAPNASAM